MGASGISTTVWFDSVGEGNFRWADEFASSAYKDVRAGLRAVVEQARHEYGNGGYSGSFAEKGGAGVQVVRMSPVTVEEASRIAWGAGDEGGRAERLSKWEHVEAIPVVRTIPATYAEPVNHTVTVMLTAAQAVDPSKVKAVVAKAAGVPAAEVESVRVAIAKRGPFTPVLEKIVKRVKAVTSKEKIVTRYFITGQQGLPTTAEQWLAGYESVAAARAALETVGISRRLEGGYAPSQREIVGVTRRADGSPIVSATIEVRSAEVTYEVTTRKALTKAKHGTQQAGWYIFGYASS